MFALVLPNPLSEAPSYLPGSRLTAASRPRSEVRVAAFPHVAKAAAPSGQSPRHRAILRRCRAVPPCEGAGFRTIPRVENPARVLPLFLITFGGRVCTQPPPKRLGASPVAHNARMPIRCPVMQPHRETLRRVRRYRRRGMTGTRLSPGGACPCGGRIPFSCNSASAATSFAPRLRVTKIPVALVHRGEHQSPVLSGRSKSAARWAGRAVELLPSALRSGRQRPHRGLPRGPHSSPGHLLGLAPGADRRPQCAGPVGQPRLVLDGAGRPDFFRRRIGLACAARRLGVAAVHEAVDSAGRCRGAERQKSARRRGSLRRIDFPSAIALVDGVEIGGSEDAKGRAASRTAS